jgi:hypothetical protein
MSCIILRAKIGWDGEYLHDQREDLFGLQPMEVGGANRHRAVAKWGGIYQAFRCALIYLNINHSKLARFCQAPFLLPLRITKGSGNGVSSLNS